MRNLKKVFKDIVEEEEQTPVSGDMYLTTSIVTEQIGETNLENISPYEKPYIIPPFSKELGIAKQINHLNEETDLFDSEYHRDLSSPSTSKERTEEDNDFNTYEYSNVVPENSREDGNDHLLPITRAHKEENITISKQYLDKTKYELEDLASNKKEELENKSQVLQENVSLKKTMKNSKKQESIISAAIKDPYQNVGKSIESGTNVPWYWGSTWICATY